VLVSCFILSLVAVPQSYMEDAHARSPPCLQQQQYCVHAMIAA
jgi:hypothetical protein